MFAHDISRIGYTNEGRIYSIICPQQGATSPTIGTMNVEVTVTKQRGWVNETRLDLAAGMQVVGKVWFSPSANQKPLVKLLWDWFKSSNHRFPSNKLHAIEIPTYKPGNNPNDLTFPIYVGESKGFPIPDFARHSEEAWSVGNLGVEIDSITMTNDPVVDDFNQLIMDIFNGVSGNMLQPRNELTWNLWFSQPQLVDTEEWMTHAERWRRAIQADHGPESGTAMYFDGTPFKPFKPLDLIEKDECNKLRDFFKKHEAHIEGSVIEKAISLLKK